MTADYAFGTQLQDAAANVVSAGGGKVLGSVRVPLGTADFSSFVLQAQNSGAQVLGLANAGDDFTNSLKTANQFGVTRKMKPAALLAFITDIHSLGLETAQGLYLTTGWYWDLNDKTRAFARRFYLYSRVECGPWESQPLDGTHGPRRLSRLQGVCGILSQGADRSDGHADSH